MGRTRMGLDATRSRPATYSVVIPTTGVRDSLRRCVEAATAQTCAPADVVVVAAAPASRPAWLAPHVRFATAPASTAGQRNLGARLATGDVVLFIDDDTILARDFAQEMLTTWADMSAQQVVVGASGVIGNEPPVRPVRNFVYFVLGLSYSAYRAPANRLRRSGHIAEVAIPRVPTSATFLHGGCAAYNRDIFLQEPFDDSFDGYVLGEDRDLAARMNHYGTLLQIPAAVCHATEVTSTGPVGHYDLGYLHGERLSCYRWRHRGKGLFGTTCWIHGTLGQIAILAIRGLHGEGWDGLRGYLAGLRVTCRDIRRRRYRRWHAGSATRVNRRDVDGEVRLLREQQSPRRATGR